MTYSSCLTDKDGNVIECENKTYCSCCGEDVTDDPRGYWCSEKFENHTTDERVRYLVLCVPCFKRTFNY